MTESSSSLGRRIEVIGAKRKWFTLLEMLSAVITVHSVLLKLYCIGTAEYFSAGPVS